MGTWTRDDACHLAEGALTRSKVSDRNARSVATALVRAELGGQGGHGLRRLASYCAQSANGKVDGYAVPTLADAATGIIAVDAALGFAYPAIDLAITELSRRVPQTGIAMAAINRSHHCGVMGDVVDRIARNGLVALMVANTPAAMAPFGGTKAVFGTNPIAFSAPRAGGEPIVIDLALSTVARGKIMAAQQKGETIPLDWALGPNGQPTDDPASALSGTMYPLGGAKGSALALMVEILAASLIGANTAAQASSFLDGTGEPPATGQTIIAIDPSAFAGDALARIDELARSIEQQDGARLPGTRRHALVTRMSVDAIDLPDDLVAQIEAIGR